MGGGGGGGGGGGLPHQATCRPCLPWIFRVNQLFINLGIPSDHASFLHKQCNKFDATSDVSYSYDALSNLKKKFF